MKALGVIRVSTDEQVEGFGLDIQEEAIRQFCAAEGHELVAIYRDEGVSGTKEWHERPGLTAALLALEDGEADVLVTYKLDRIARSLLVQEVIIDRLRKIGAQLLSVKEPIANDGDDDDPTRKFVRQVLGAAAELEWGLIRQRMTAGRAMKAARGGFIGGEPPFGYMVIDGMLVPDPTEQDILAAAKALRDSGKSLRAVASQLPTNPRTGRPFNHNSINRMCAA